MAYNYTQFDIENRLEGKIKVAVLDQPETFNALNKMVLKELREFMEECDDDPEVRCIAITGKGAAFSSGQNLKRVVDLIKAEDATNVVEKIVLDYYNPLVLSIVKNKKPVVSLVNGAAVGAGAMLALICDITLAKESAYFTQAFTGIGLIPDTAGTYYLPKLLGRQTASYLAFTGQKISTQEAKDLGLIADVFPDAEFEAKANAVLEVIAKRPTMAIGLTKRAFLHSYDNTLLQQLDLESKYQQKASESADFEEGVAAFLEKREAQFIGK